MAATGGRALLSEVALVLALALLLLQAAQATILVSGGLRIRRLPAHVPAPPPAGWPRVSIVVAARNEATEIEAATRSLLALDYPARELIVVEDRSEDATGAILERLRAEHAELRVVPIRELPAGWLGKNHALQRGAERARGELLLFTDADVVFAPPALRKAVAVLVAEHLDHLTLAGSVHSPSRLVNLLIAFFSRSFVLLTRPWKARDPRSKRSIGIGAFNLIRREVYLAVGGHAAIAMRPDDDLRLGERIKRAGYRQEFRGARDEFTLAWYSSFGAFVHGLEKNVLAAFDYRTGRFVLALAVQLAMGLLPWALACAGHGLVRWLALAAIALSAFTYALFLRLVGCSVLLCPLEPLACVLSAYTFGRSALLALVRGGIEWRGTFYSLQELRKPRMVDGRVWSGSDRPRSAR